jgi:DNA-binding beta-propeller fold protein YncE
VAVDPHGDIYVADTGNNRIQKLSPTDAALAQWRASYVHAGRLSAPAGLAVDTHNDLYVADTENNRIVKLSPEGQVQGMWGAQGYNLGQFIQPSSVAVDSRGNLYVMGYDGRVEELSPSDRPLIQWGNVPDKPKPFICACRLAVDPAGRVVVADRYAWAIQEFSWTGRLLRSFAAPNPNVPRSHFDGVAVGQGGAIYVTEDAGATVTRLAPDGKIQARWGSQGSGPGQLSDPHGIAVDARGDVYVADTGNHRIEKFSSEGKLLAVIGQEGTGPGRFESPSDVVVDSQGNIYVADTGNNRVQKFAPQG